MALIKCIECGKDISDTTDVCVHCGAPTSISLVGKSKGVTKSKKNAKHNIIIPIVICLLVLCFVIIGIPFFVNLRNKNIASSNVIEGKYSAPKYEAVYGNAMKTIFNFKSDGTVTYQFCNIDTDACADSRYYTYKKQQLNIDIYDYDNSLLYECSLKDSGNMLGCYDMSHQYMEYVKND